MTAVWPDAIWEATHGEKLDLAHGGGISTFNWIGWRKATEHLWRGTGRLTFTASDDGYLPCYAVIHSEVIDLSAHSPCRLVPFPKDVMKIKMASRFKIAALCAVIGSFIAWHPASARLHSVR